MTGTPTASAVMATVAEPTRAITVPLECTAAAPRNTWVEECSSFIIVHLHECAITMPGGGGGGGGPPYWSLQYAHKESSTSFQPHQAD